jgi:beta-alanine--pyruvate transaminase
MPRRTILSAFWMPFTANRQFKKRGRACSSGAKDMHYTTASTAAGSSTAPPACGASTPAMAAIADRGRDRRSQAGDARLRAAFQLGHPKAFELASRLAATSRPKGLEHVFFTNSGSESVDTALKIALAYHRAGAGDQAPG